MFGSHLRSESDLERIEGACATRHALAEARRAGGRSLVSFVLSRRAALREMSSSVRALPRIEVITSAGPAGREIAKHLSVRHVGRHVNRRAVGVLPLPEHPDLYLQGGKRQAARTNLHHAEELGFSFRELSDAATTRLEAARILRLHQDEFWDAEDLARDVAQRTSRVFVVADRAGTVQALAAVVVDTKWAHMYLCISDRSPSAHAALYMLNVGVVKQLAGEGLRYLFVRSAFQLTPGQRYLQARLGFEPMNLRLSGPSPNRA
jgi:hypothetical protein